MREFSKVMASLLRLRLPVTFSLNQYTSQWAERNADPKEIVVVAG